MNDIQEFKYKVSLTASVEAFSEEDARDMIEETFGLGADCGVTIIENTIKYVK